ncbi:hypothetical protein SPHINGO8BC_90011 [Sphingobacterium multivorum]|uniref:Uncharacterized protein n=1 Tax=Sphingobacterium multivorum TaxID=28454 RepID=A0A654DNI2_SPHMU|nr:hypothetical protein SPHINGO8BC_90011 [Sphingobacterium multivorum]
MVFISTLICIYFRLVIEDQPFDVYFFEFIYWLYFNMYVQSKLWKNVSI